VPMSQNYRSWTKAQLIEHINMLEETLEKTLKQENDAFLVSFPWAGNLGQWHWFYDENKVIFNDEKVSALGYDPEKLGAVGFQFFTDKIHVEDYERVMDNMRQHLMGKTDAYEVEYRIQHKDGHYLWYYDRGKVTKKDDSGKPMVIQGVVFDITEQKKTEDKLRFYSNQDVLTSLYNRRMFFKQLEDHIAAHQKNNTPLSLVMFDIDDFKKINDQYGHHTGDAVLKSLAVFVLDDKREHDLAFRYGGDEFFLLLPNTDLDGAKQLAKRLHTSIQSKTFDTVGHITLSMGVVEYQTHESADDVVKRADKQMYQVKQSGKNNIQS